MKEAIWQPGTNVPPILECFVLEEVVADIEQM